MARAFGKVILLGEHAVVYGHPAIAAALDRGVTARGLASTDDGALDELVISPWGVRAVPEESKDGAPSLGRAFAEVLATYPTARPRVRVEAEVALPGGSGLGCSAALGVAVVRALDEALEQTHTVDEDIERSLRWEHVFHGQPSGVDNTMAASGGLALFVKGAPLERLRARRPLHLVVGDSGEASATRAMVESVARQVARAPEKTQQTFEAIATLVRNAKLAIEGGDLRGLGHWLNMNQFLLAGLLLSTPKLEEMCAAARDAGALGAKLTGGGGGGCMLALCADADAAARVRDAVAAVARDAFLVVAGDHA
jgi:mevalonate kinase